VDADRCVDADHDVNAGFTDPVLLEYEVDLLEDNFETDVILCVDMLIAASAATSSATTLPKIALLDAGKGLLFTLVVSVS
jgi:hypothetical protein